MEVGEEIEEEEEEEGDGEEGGRLRASPGEVGGVVGVCVGIGCVGGSGVVSCFDLFFKTIGRFLVDAVEGGLMGRQEEEEENAKEEVEEVEEEEEVEEGREEEEVEQRGGGRDIETDFSNG